MYPRGKLMEYTGANVIITRKDWLPMTKSSSSFPQRPNVWVSSVPLCDVCHVSVAAQTTSLIPVAPFTNMV